MNDHRFHISRLPHKLEVSHDLCQDKTSCTDSRKQRVASPYRKFNHLFVNLFSVNQSCF